MKLKDLKSSLKKFPPDMDDMEIVVMYAQNKERKFENLCFTAYIPLKGHECIALGTTSGVEWMVKEGKMEKPTGYIDPDDYESQIQI